MKVSPVRVWRRNEQRRKHLGKIGVLESYSVVRVGPSGLGKQVPYVVGLIRVGDEVAMAQLVDVKEDDLETGLELVGRLRRLVEVDKDGVIVYGVKFGPKRGEDEK